MSDVRFFVRLIWLAILCVFGWLLTFVLTEKWWAFPILLVGLVVVAIRRAREKQGRIAMLAAEADRARQEADEAQAIADRMAEEGHAAQNEAEQARQRMETRAAWRGFLSPNSPLRLWQLLPAELRCVGIERVDVGLNLRFCLVYQAGNVACRRTVDAVQRRGQGVRGLLHARQHGRAVTPE